jgi:hypothetical protein
VFVNKLLMGKIRPKSGHTRNFEEVFKLLKFLFAEILKKFLIFLRLKLLLPS